MCPFLRVSGLAVFVLVLLQSSSFAGDEEIVARIGDRKITLSDFNRLIGYDAEKKKIFEQNPQVKASFLKNVVQGMVISGIARRDGFDKRAEVKEQVEILVNAFLASEYIKKEVIGKIDVTEADIKSYYDTHKDEFRSPEMVRARHILIRVDKGASEEGKKKARARTEEILKRLSAGEDFAKLASELSEDAASKTKGGDLGFFQRGKMVPEFEKVAFSLKPGEVSTIVETQFGFHIIKVEERKESALEPYDKVKDKVKEKIFAEVRKARIEEFIDKAMKDARAELNVESLTAK